MMIGAGIFALIGPIAELAGPPFPLTLIAGAEVRPEAVATPRSDQAISTRHDVVDRCKDEGRKPDRKSTRLNSSH